MSFRVEGASGVAGEATIAQVRQQPAATEETVATTGCVFRNFSSRSNDSWNIIGRAWFINVVYHTACAAGNLELHRRGRRAEP